MKFEFESRESDSPFVKSIWQTQSEVSGSFLSLANTHWSMVVSKYEGKTSLTVRGPETKVTPAECPAGAEFLGINFKVGTYMPHIPAKIIMDRQDMRLPEASSQSFWLHGSAWQFPDFENVDTFIERLLRQGLLECDPLIDAALQGYPAYASPRSLQYRFLHITGLTHNTIQQIERARHALTLLQQGASITDTVHQAGYFDQSHLTRSFKRYMGQTPAQIVRESDFR